jgi:aconitate hydratase
LQDWVSAKDVILELLRRHGVSGGLGYVLEYYGSGLENLSAMDRHTIANMGAELGATASVFPSDHITRRFLKSQVKHSGFVMVSAARDSLTSIVLAQDRERDFVELLTPPNPSFDRRDVINLNELQPLIALPHSPGNVKPVSEVAGLTIGQAMIGSSANPGVRDFAVPALMFERAQKRVPHSVKYDVNPTSRQILHHLTTQSYLARLIKGKHLRPSNPISMEWYRLVTCSFRFLCLCALRAKVVRASIRPDVTGASEWAKRRVVS